MPGEEVSPAGSLKRYLPILTWLPGYQRGWLIADLVAAVTVLTLLVPEGIASAQMAGLPPETTFYTAPAALIGYALFTTSRQVITTTTSTIAVMVAAVLGGLAVAGSEEYLILSASMRWLNCSKISPARISNCGWPASMIGWVQRSSSVI